MLRSDTNSWWCASRGWLASRSGRLSSREPMSDICRGTASSTPRSFDDSNRPPPAPRLGGGALYLISDRLSLDHRDSPVYFHGSRSARDRFRALRPDRNVAIHIFIATRPGAGTASRADLGPPAAFRDRVEGLKLGTESLRTLFSPSASVSHAQCGAGGPPGARGSEYLLIRRQSAEEAADRCASPIVSVFPACCARHRRYPPVDLNGCRSAALPRSSSNTTRRRYDPGSGDDRDRPASPCPLLGEAPGSPTPRGEPDDETHRLMERLVTKGLRAPSLSGSLLTGQASSSSPSPRMRRRLRW